MNNNIKETNMDLAVKTATVFVRCALTALFAYLFILPFNIASYMQMFFGILFIHHIIVVIKAAIYPSKL